MKYSVRKAKSFDRKRYLFLFLFLHITLLDLFYISEQGAVVMWQENLSFVTQGMHLLVLAIVFIVYKLISSMR
ncbi:hypothetical protein [Thalassotalea agarivorans]|uniref:Uncharacterized protein n=1 Tax=Thalassotalea agarivorans TaxID=349064 RepID=A0A1I0HUP5_THASX|nr:hypothetical protein [Thalassotalea agarivorans]SET87787.1 hypothetical protein SAMN05660429_02946 [Thalassotalea agarivorans]